MGQEFLRLSKNISLELQMPYNIQQKYEKIVLQLHPEHRNAFQTIKLSCLETKHIEDKVKKM